MAEKKKIPLGGNQVEAWQLDVVKRGKEDLVEYELEDGAVIRVANPVVLAYRLETFKDAEGNPGYIVKLGTSVTVVRGPRTASNGSST